MDLKFGDLVIIRGRITRTSDYDKSSAHRMWYRYELNPSIVGTFLGPCQLSNGEIVTENHGDEGIDHYYEAKEYIKGAWVWYDRSPKKVFLSDCEKVQ